MGFGAAGLLQGLGAALGVWAHGVACDSWLLNWLFCPHPQVAHDMLGPGHKDRAALAEEMRAVISDMVEAEKRKKQVAAEQAAAARKKFHYKGGVTIEEEVDEESASGGSAAAGGALTPGQVKKVEDDAAALVLRLRKQAADVRQEWERGEQQRRQAWEQEQEQAATTADAAAPLPPLVQPPQQQQQPQVPEASSAPVSDSTAAAAELDELRKRGNELFRSGDSLGALALYEQCLLRDPGSVAVHANLALAKVGVEERRIWAGLKRVGWGLPSPTCVLKTWVEI